MAMGASNLLIRIFHAFGCLSRIIIWSGTVRQ